MLCDAASTSPGLVISEEEGEEEDDASYPLETLSEAGSSPSPQMDSNKRVSSSKRSRTELGSEVDIEGLDVNVLLVDFICILCQRVCNEAYAVNCSSEHRFCKECILPRWNNENPYCPRCNEKYDISPRHDQIWDSLIAKFGYDKHKVNYVCLDLNYSSGSDEEYLEMYGCDDYEVEHYNRRRMAAKRSCWKHPPASRLFANDDEEENVLAKRYKAGLEGNTLPNSSLFGASSEYKWGRSTRKCGIVPSYRSIIKPEHQERNRKRPLENMTYKNFKCNEGHVWPNPKPPAPPFGLPRDFRFKLRRSQKTVRGFVNDAHLTKREKKVCVHKYLTEEADPRWSFPQYSSSSDDDAPSAKPPKTKFIIPEGYRQRRYENRRRDPKQEIDSLHHSPLPPGATISDTATTNSLSITARTHSSFCDKAGPIMTYKSNWGNPLLLIRDNLTKSELDESLLTRLYLGSDSDTTIAHLKQFLYRRIVHLLDITEETAKDEFVVSVFEVTMEMNGGTMCVLNCNKSSSESGSSSSNNRSTSSPRKSVEDQQPTTSNHADASSASKCNTTKQSSLKSGFSASANLQVEGKRLIFPFGNTEPTVREVALRTMSRRLKDDKKVFCAEKAVFAAHPSPTVNDERSDGISELHSKSNPPETLVRLPYSSRSMPNLVDFSNKNCDPVSTSKPSIFLPSSSTGAMNRPPSFTTLIPVGKAFNTTLPFARKQFRHRQEMTIASEASDVLQVVQSVDPVTKSITYSQITTDGKLIPLKGKIVQCSAQNRPVHVKAAPLTDSRKTDVRNVLEEATTTESVKLSDKCTVFATHFPHRPLSETTTLGELRSRRHLGQFERLALFFSVADRQI